jgi:hypothetical protein
MILARFISLLGTDQLACCQSYDMIKSLEQWKIRALYIMMMEYESYSLDFVSKI